MGVFERVIKQHLRRNLRRKEILGLTFAAELRVSQNLFFEVSINVVLLMFCLHHVIIITRKINNIKCKFLSSIGVVKTVSPYCCDVARPAWVYCPVMKVRGVKVLCSPSAVCNNRG